MKRVKVQTIPYQLSTLNCQLPIIPQRLKLNLFLLGKNKWPL